MLTSLLIANRGEIACRIIRTAQRLGFRTVAVYSDADAAALHVRQADEAVHIGASPARESYLRGDRIIAVAQETGAEAIHPGYGFLSENADFAQAVIDAGLVWVGPRPDSIRAMGLKDAAKERMIAAGVPVTPGYLGADQTIETLRREAGATGYPVLIKAVAGGGGKGMRRVGAAEDFADALESCRREASSSFGDDRVLIEKYILSPRHIEVQVFGDTYGNVVHLFERDCSLQRRHQKVIEEAPAPGMDPDTREAICAAAVRAAKAVDYVGAGTIEFIADASEGLRADRIWFMEMNTRLQVEHPVTEEITGIDLVEWQLRVASGETLPMRQDELSIQGWAMEARLYAEDPAKGFLPSIGQLSHLNLGGVERLETGVVEGDAVSSFYDPMIAKLVVSADTRLRAAEELTTACAGIEVWPIKTNAALLAQLASSTEFRAGLIDTGFVDCFTSNDDRDEPSDRVFTAAISWRLEAFATAEWKTQSSGMPDPWEGLPGGIFGFRLNSNPMAAHLPFRIDDEKHVAKVSPVSNGDGEWRWSVSVDGREMDADCGLPTTFGPVAESGVEQPFYLFDRGLAYTVSFRAERGGEQAVASSGMVLAPIPGRITAVAVQVGDAVTIGQTLVTLEAMKMEQNLVAPFDGMISEVVVPGVQVSESALLVRVERPETK